LELVKIRFGDRLLFKIDFSSHLSDVLVPSLILQTLIENAVKHGISKSLKGGFIHLETKDGGDGFCYFRLANTGKPYSMNTVEGTGISNTRARLRLICGERHQFNIENTKDEGTLVTFRVPINKHEHPL
jgi:sensor histidine kinase YesM